jgi:hypothetical protein
MHPTHRSEPRQQLGKPSKATAHQTPHDTCGVPPRPCRYVRPAPRAREPGMMAPPRCKLASQVMMWSLAPPCLCTGLPASLWLLCAPAWGLPPLAGRALLTASIGPCIRRCQTTAADAAPSHHSHWHASEGQGPGQRCCEGNEARPDVLAVMLHMGSPACVMRMLCAGAASQHHAACCLADARFQKP